MLSREQLIEEQQLRKLVRKAIYKVYEKKQNQKTNEETKIDRDWETFGVSSILK